MEKLPTEACSVVIAGDEEDKVIHDNLNELAVVEPVSKSNKEQQKSTRSRWHVIFDMSRGNDNASQNVEDEATREDTSKLEMAVEDVIIALEFDYYVLGVALFRLFTTIGFCIIFAVLLNSGTPTAKMYTQSNAVYTELAPSTSPPNTDTTVRFYDIESVEDVYDWLTDTSIPTVFVSTDHTGKALPDYQLGHLDLSNRVLGGVILKMTPRKFISCNSEFVLLELYPMCTKVDYPEVKIDFLDIAWDAVKAKAVVADSGEVSVFTVTSLKVNFLKSGLFDVEAATNSIPDYRGRTWVTIIPVVCSYIVFGWILRYLENARPPLVKQTRNKGEKANIFSDKASHKPEREKPKSWKLHFFAIVGEFCLKFGALPAFAALWTVTISLDFDKDLLKLPDTTGKTLEEKHEDIAVVVDKLHVLADWTNALSIVGAIAVLQLGLYTIRQLSFHPQLSVFARTVGNSLRQFRDFFLVFLIIFITFSFMGNLLFGDRVREFSTASLSRESCMNMLFGTFDFSTIYNIRGSGWFYWGYMIIVSLILLNMMLAIVMGTYEAMSKDGYQGEVNVMLASRISTIYRYLFQYVRRKWKGLPPKHPARRKPSDNDSQAVIDFNAMNMDIRELEHDDVIAYGKFRPPLLLLILQTKLQHDPSFSSTTMVTPALLRGLFSQTKCNISDREMIDTFEFLREGYALNEAVTKQGQAKKAMPGESKSTRLAELQQNLKELMDQVSEIHKEIQTLTTTS